MRERGDLGDQPRLDRLAGDQQLDRLDAGRGRRGDEVLTLGDEQAQLLPPPAPGELADQLERLVVT
jgi:hypothetical protein